MVQTRTRRGMTKFKYMVCLENTCEPHYFTEKFVNAARAGCIPIYHAHPTVRNSILQGAAWIDPADFGYDASATLDAAYRVDTESIVSQNYTWVQSKAVLETDGLRIWQRIADSFLTPTVSAPDLSGRLKAFYIHNLRSRLPRSGGVDISR